MGAIHFVVLALGRWTQEDAMFEASVGYEGSPISKKTKQNPDLEYEFVSTIVIMNLPLRYVMA